MASVTTCQPLYSDLLAQVATLQQQNAALQAQHYSDLAFLSKQGLSPSLPRQPIVRRSTKRVKQEC